MGRGGDESVADVVADRIRDAIVSGQLAPGSGFSTRAVGEWLGVSFIPVREALRDLRAEGLIVHRVGRRPAVAPLDTDELFGVHRLRRLIEPELAAQAAELCQPADLSQAEELLAGLADPARSPDERHAAHHRFHAVLLRPASTPADRRVLRTAWRVTERCMRVGLSDADRDRLECELAEQHRALLEPFRAEDAAGVRAAMREHLRDSLRLALRGIAPG
ncbi:GntR family transcriptional regulator [Pseudonocardia eucalypti]|uniref:GntR family transcriptional regulator n=1 Tax=Pseudonocardia eucalypti TaxID=648755 RepID=A0ABP9Q217_9PSEU|nr:DNA-binding GntR family transcriptional regulator [Pseudonocardia eucalypti]